MIKEALSDFMDGVSEFISGINPVCLRTIVAIPVMLVLITGVFIFITPLAIYHTIVGD